MGKYDNLPKEQLLLLIENLEQENKLLVKQKVEGREELLQEKITIGQTITNLLTTLLNSDESNQIDQSLTLLLKFFDVDRVYIAWYYEDRNALRITDEVTKNRLFSIVNEMEDIKPDVFPWWFSKILSGQDINLPDVSQMPPEAANDQALLMAQEILSLLVLPLFSNGKPCGFIGLDAVKQKRRWTAIDRENLRTLSNIILIALEKRQSYRLKIKSEQHLHELYNNMPLGYMYKQLIKDEAGTPVDFEYVNINKPVEKLFDIKKADIIGKRYNQTIAPLLPDDIFEEEIAVAQCNSPVITEKYAYLRGQLLKFIIYSPTPGYVVTLCIEVSSTHELEEEMLRSEAKFRFVFDKLPLGIELYDAAGYLIDLNKTDKKLFGVTREDVLGTNLFNNPNLPPDKLELLKNGKEVSLTFEYNFNNIQNNNFYYVIPEKRNKKLHLFIQCMPLKDNSEKVYGYMIIVNDETEKIQKAEETEEMFTKLKTAVGSGDSLMWEYDVAQDKMHVNLELKNSDRESKLRVFPFETKKDIYNIIHPDDKEWVLNEHFERLIRGEIASYNIKYRRMYKNEFIWVKAYAQSYKFNNDGTPSKILYYLSNITDEINLQDKLRDIENENRKIGYAVAKSQDEIYALNESGRFTFINKRALEIYDFGDNYTEQFIWDINPDYKIDQWKILVDKLRKNQAEVQETTHMHPDGTTFPVEIYIYRIETEKDGELFWCFARNITERIQQHQQIVSLNSMMDTILNNVPVVIYVKDINNDFNIIYFNKAGERFTGKDAASIIGNNDYVLFDDIQRANEIRQLDMLAVQQGGYSQYAVNYVTPLKQTRIVNEIRIPILSVKTNPVLIVLLWDITEQQQNEIELIKAKEADKLKSTFLANMSHEIRTPLNAIIGFSDIAMEENDPEERQIFSNIIHKNCDLLLQLINDILDFSKIEAGTLEINQQYVDIKDICQEIYTTHSIKIPEQITFLFSNDHPSVKIYTDPGRMMQVISNFLTNAIKFTSQGTIRLSYETEGNNIKVSVSDTGIGISENDFKSIFQRFVKINEFKQGTGLGLAISKMIIERLGGTIGLNSEKGKGSVFWFTLPLLSADVKIQPKELLSENEVQHPVQTKASSILIAEDVEENFLLLKIVLGKKYTLYHAHNGIEAVELYKKYRPDIILMDIKMPEMDGFEATRIIRAMSETVPILALTAFAFEKDKQIACECKFNDYIVKPINVKHLEEKVGTYFTEGSNIDNK